jgi:hypothetical protein
MTEGEMCPDETKSAPIGPPQAVRPPNSVPHGQESGSWFPDLACSAIIRLGLRRHLGNVGYIADNENPRDRPKDMAPYAGARVWLHQAFPEDPAHVLIYTNKRERSLIIFSNIGKTPRWSSHDNQRGVGGKAERNRLTAMAARQHAIRPKGSLCSRWRWRDSSRTASV